MKVKNLLLAGLAVAAMTACSNNDEIVENGIQTTGEEASMQINLKFAIKELELYLVNQMKEQISKGNLLQLQQLLCTRTAPKTKSIKT